MAATETAARAGAFPAFRFDPLWLADALGAAGLGALVWALSGGPGAPEFASIAREAGPLALAIWIGGRLTVAAVSGRLKRGAARADIHARLIALDGALADLRRSVTRDSALEFLERADRFAAAFAAGRTGLNGKERGFAGACAEAAASLADTVRDALGDRHGVEALAERIRRDVLRAERFGDFDTGEAEALLDAMDDAVALLDQALYVEHTADHFGRLEADRRTFHRRLERLYGAAAARVEERAADLFEALRSQLAVKVAIAEAALEWREAARGLEARLSSAVPSLVAAETAPLPRPPRFATVSLPAQRPSAQVIRLPAAND